MTRKQRLYKELASACIGYVIGELPHLRISWWRSIASARQRWRSVILCKAAAELAFQSLHAMNNDNPDINTGDTGFLNEAARWFFDACGDDVPTEFDGVLTRIIELLNLVPEELWPQLTWKGPRNLHRFAA